LGKLSPTQVTIQPADRSVKIPKGEVTNVLIRVGKFTYPVDFIVLDTQPVQHRIHLNEETKPKRDPQHKLNPIMQEAVRAEIVKLLDNEIIYPISDNEWVSSVHAVPKKSGFTVIENETKS